MSDYTRLNALVAKFRKGSPNIAAAFDEVEKILKQHDAATEAFVSVSVFGAKGDGIADDTVAVQHAIDTAAAEGGVVLFPSGTYLVSGLVLSSQVVLQGVNGSSYLSAPGGAISRLLLRPGSTSPLLSGDGTGVKVLDLMLDTNNVAQSAVFLPDSTGSVPRFWTIERCLIVNSGYSAANRGYSVYVGNLNTGCLVRDCQVLSNAAGATPRGAHGWDGIGWYGQDGLLDNTFVGCFANTGVTVLGGSSDTTFVARGGGTFWNLTGIVVGGTGAVIDGMSIDHNYNDGAYVGYPSVFANCVFHTNSLQTNNQWSHLKVGTSATVIVAHCRQAPQSPDGGSNLAKYFISAASPPTVTELGNFQDPGATLGTAWRN